MDTIAQLPPFPGFGLHLNYDPKEDDEAMKLFATALDPEMDDRDCSTRMPVLTLREIAMMQFMNEVTDKKGWETKVFDNTICQKWKTEALATPAIRFTEQMANYCIEELKYKAELYKKNGFVSVYNGDVVKSDIAIPSTLQNALRAAVAPLENVPEQKKDWHPGSNGLVLDLVHPSLFPLVYGLSRVLVEQVADRENCVALCGQGMIAPISPDAQAMLNTGWEQRRVFSQKFQWLPCDVDVSGETPKILSYINNLHPKDHVGLYSVIEKIIGRILPLWNATLTPLRSFAFKQRVEYEVIDYGDLEKVAATQGPQQEDDEDDYDFEDRVAEWMDDRKTEFVDLPEPKPFVRPDVEPTMIDLKTEYAETGLQMIIKLANIHLTPEKSEYGGGTWHVEGQMNEHICASAIYYYDNENITPSHLAFRQASSISDIEGMGYEQNDHAWLNPVFGLENETAAIQNIGSIEALLGRLVTFPNILQHQVQPFKLADPTKPGHRKILAIFLVDPNIRIVSTSNVPCQQRDWWGRDVISNERVMPQLPYELRDKVVQVVDDFPINLDQAKKLRDELMRERKEYVLGHQAKCFENVTISLCEH